MKKHIYKLASITAMIASATLLFSAEGRTPDTPVVETITRGTCRIDDGTGMGTQPPFRPCVNSGVPCQTVRRTFTGCVNGSQYSSCEPEAIEEVLAAGACGWGYIPEWSDCKCRY